MAYLNLEGLSHFFAYLKSNFVRTEEIDDTLSTLPINADTLNNLPSSAFFKVEGGTFTGTAIGVSSPAETVPQLRNTVIYPSGTDLAAITVPAGTIVNILK